MLIDCHIHLPSMRVDEAVDVDQEIQRAREAGVGAWIVTGTTIEDSKAVLDMVKGRDDLFACVGVHPCRVDTYKKGTLKELTEVVASSPKVVGVGEVGLDYVRTELSPDLQKKAFREQIRLAREWKLPLNLHTYGKETAMDLVKVLHEERAYNVGGVLHNFMGNHDMAHRLIDMGVYVSVSIVLMHPQAHRLRKVYKELPLGTLVIDTDWPAAFLERTEPGDYPYDMDKRTALRNLRILADHLAGIKEVSVEQVINVTSMNTLRAFPRMAAQYRGRSGA